MDDKEFDLNDYFSGNSDFTFSTEDEDVIRVTEDGKVTVVGAGSAVVKLDPIPSSNTKPSEPIYVTVVITEKHTLDETNASEYVEVIPSENNTYDGTEKPAIIQGVNGAELGNVTIYYELPDGSLTTQPPINAGTYNVYITTQGSENFNEVTEPVKVGAVVIEKADAGKVEYKLPDGLTYTGKPLDVVVTTPNGEDVGEIEYVYKDSETGEIIPEIVDSGKYDVYIKTNGNENFNQTSEETKVGTVVVDKATVTTENLDDLADIKVPQVVAPELGIQIELPSNLVGGAEFKYKKYNEDDFMTVVPSTPGRYEVWMLITGNSNFNVSTDAMKVGEFTIDLYETHMEIEKANYTKTFGDADFSLEGITSNSDSEICYKIVEGSSVISLEDNVVSILSAGEARIKVYTTETELYKAVESHITVTIAKSATLPESIEKPAEDLQVTLPTGSTTLGDLDLSGYPGWVVSPEYKDVTLEPGTKTEVVLIYVGDGHENYENNEMTIIVTVPPAGTEIISPSTPTTPDVPLVSITPTQKPAATKPTTKPEITPNLSYVKVGTLVKVGAHYYKITKDIYKGATVSYAKPVNKKLTKVTIPATVTIKNCSYKVTAVEKKAFNKCVKLKTVKIGKNVKTVGTKAFYGCKKLTKVTIGSNVTSIGNEAFRNCTALKNIKIPNKVKTIGTKAFYNCSKLTKITLGSKLTTIKASAFGNCKKLTKITIPKNVTSLGGNLFKGCKKLKTVTIKSTKLKAKKINKKAFSGVPTSTKVKVPSKKIKTYKTMLVKKGLSKKVKVTK